ncbi:hypothetical protein LCH33_004731 [Pseudomonas amygdali]|uniref:Multi-domain non-ribosomal peptide synthetase n=1 Tax=Pseudomonas amygdali pv. hibisci TaxID=251723 RepID=A0AB34U963_PSEA0|nr:condensation domain-containing protein [Pseudomonas amygdali]KPC51983.1 Multi-domain non-ribosomal peptide synthetase [Pseudomonas amygdali pv. morsprunorum]KPX55520.1 Multi-domain non-ribosomal peptide synthetase [Pseudomonas amygdali pv. hibisci]RMN58654.1 Multi-domain non-ribosomal peptide synthetase [Pseudomonas amygdali pv. hibisci]UBT81288.1 hypothetical protein LCH33_004731 [Pseudomonas amygdali]
MPSNCDKEQFLSELLGELRGEATASSTDVLSGLEAMLLDIWCESFARPVQSDDNYFALGGDSLKSIRISARAKRAGLSIAMQDIINYPTVRALAKHLATGTEGERPPAGPLTSTRNIQDGIYPSTAAQEGMLYHCLAAPHASLYVSQFSCVLVGALDPARFESALRLLIRRHPALRTAFAEDLRARHCQRLHDEVALDYQYDSPVVAAQAEQLQTLVRNERERPFDLATPPLLRIRLVRLSADRHLWVWTQHHLVADGRSQELMIAELADLYCRLGPQPDLQVDEDHSYRDLLLATESVHRYEPRFWSEYLAHAEPVALLETRGDDAVPVEVSFELSQAQLQRLTAALADAQVTMASAFSAWFALALAVTFERRDLLVGLVTSGRHGERACYANTVGNLISTLPLRATLNRGRTLKQWMRATQRCIADLQSHEHASLPDIKRGIGWPAELALFDAIYVHENHATTDQLFSARTGLRVEDTRFHINEGYPLILVCEQGARARLTLRFQSQACPQPLAQALLSRVARLCDIWPGAASLDLLEVAQQIK